MRLALTGARGRLARALREHFCSGGHEVVAFSRTADESRKGLDELPSFLRDTEVQAVLHLGWSTVPATAEQMPASERQDDLPLLAKINACLLDRPPDKRPLLMFFSTGAVYGEKRAGAAVFSETDVVNPIGAYSKGKVAAEKLVGIAMTEGLPAAILRVTNVYGMVDLTGMPQGVIPAIARAADTGHPFEVWGSGAAVKDYLHVRDLARAVEAILGRKLEGIFNVASGQAISLHKILQMAQAHLGKVITTKERAAPAWDVQQARYSSAKLRTAAGWAPQVDFMHGLAETLNSWLDARRALP
jgi:UDP-glucose 4-epimerase